MEPFRYHVFVCDQRKPEWVPCCSARGSGSVLDVLRREIAHQGLTDAVQITICGSLGLCEHGPNMVVYPEGIWYSRVTPPDAVEIVRSHFRDGNVVEKLARFDTEGVRAEILSNREKMQAALRAKESAGVLPDELVQTIRSFQESRTILTAIELDLFSAVGPGSTAAEVSERIGTNARATELLLNALCSMQLMQKANGVYRNTPVTARYFVRGTPDFAGDSHLHMVNLWTRWSTLTDAIRAGTSVAGPPGRVEDGTGAFISAMDRIARERAPLVVRAVGAAGRRRMLDVGGGSAAYSISFCRDNPELEADVLDLPSVVELCRLYVERAGLASRIRIRPGDLQRDALGSGYDLVLVSQICHSLGEEENLDLMKKCYEALVPGGMLVIQEFLLEKDRTAPKHAALFALNMLVGTPAGRAYSEVEISDWLGQTGFRDIRRIQLPGPSGLLLARRG